MVKMVPKHGHLKGCACLQVSMLCLQGPNHNIPSAIAEICWGITSGADEQELSRCCTWLAFVLSYRNLAMAFFESFGLCECAEWTGKLAFDANLRHHKPHAGLKPGPKDQLVRRASLT